MLIRIHPRIAAKRPEFADEDVAAAVRGAVRTRWRDTDPAELVGAGLDPKGRLMQFVAVAEEPGGWLVFHAMPATKRVLREVGLGR